MSFASGSGNSLFTLPGRGFLCGYKKFNGFRENQYFQSARIKKITVHYQHPYQSHGHIFHPRHHDLHPSTYIHSTYRMRFQRLDALNFNNSENRGRLNLQNDY